MTDDLEGRLDPASLEETPSKAERMPDGTEPVEDFYAANGGLVYPVPAVELPSPPKVSVVIAFETGQSFALEGNLQSLSFGPEGWLCALNTEDKNVLSIALHASREPVTAAHVKLPDGEFVLWKNVDCAASFSYGSASFTVTSDEARYV